MVFHGFGPGDYHYEDAQQAHIDRLEKQLHEVEERLHHYEALTEPKLGRYEVECGFPKRKDGLKLHLCERCKKQKQCILPRPPKVYKCSDFEQPEAKAEAGEFAKVMRKYYSEYKGTSMVMVCKRLLEACDHIDRLEAENKRLRDALEKLSRLGNEPHLGNSEGNKIAQAALKGTK